MSRKFRVEYTVKVTGEIKLIQLRRGDVGRGVLNKIV